MLVTVDVWDVVWLGIVALIALFVAVAWITARFRK